MLENLSVEDTNQIVNSLVDGRLEDSDKRSIEQIYRSSFTVSATGGQPVSRLDADFVNAVIPKWKQLAARLAHDPDIRQASRDTWSGTIGVKADTARLVDIARKVTEIAADVYGRTAIRNIDTFFGPPGSSGSYQFETDSLRFNRNPNAVKFTDFGKWLNTISHEFLHREQHDLSVDLKQGLVPVTNPRRAQVEAFAVNSQYYVQPRNATGFTAYEYQPQEAHSRQGAREIEDEFNTVLSTIP